MKNAIKNTTWEKAKTKFQSVWGWVSQKLNSLLGKVGFNWQGVVALIILVLAGIAAVFATLGIMTILIFFIMFYLIFVVIASIFYQIYSKLKK